MAHKRPEHAAAELMRGEGWAVSTCEGGPILLLMKAACLDLLMAMNRLGADDSLTRFFEAQVTIHQERVSEIADAVNAASTGTVVKNFERIYASGVDQYYPGVTTHLIEGMHTALGPKLGVIFQRFSTDPYKYRAGWPDLTLVRDDEVRFQEVKTSDKLHASQFATFGDVLVPCGFIPEVVQLVKPPKIKSS